MASFNLVRIEMMRLQAKGPLRSKILKKIGEKWGIPGDEALAAFFSASGIATPELAASLGRSLVRFYTRVAVRSPCLQWSRESNGLSRTSSRRAYPYIVPSSGNEPGVTQGLVQCLRH